MPLDKKEMIAMVAYMKWLSTGVPTGQHVKGDDGMELDYPNRPADPQKGAIIFAQNCASCHGMDGQGVMAAGGITYQYPPLWGKYGYERGSSMHRVLKAARFIKANMPNGKATWEKPLLTDAEAIDVSAFINSDELHDRPNKRGMANYPNPKVKAIDYDEGPYVDTFSATQHKYGPYTPIIQYHKEHGLPVIF